jgi:hypothetical protein
MSQGNVEIVRRVIQSVSDRAQVAEEYYDPNVEYTTMPNGPIHATYYGIQGLRDSLANLQESWDSMMIDVRNFIEVGGAMAIEAACTFVVGAEEGRYGRELDCHAPDIGEVGLHQIGAGPFDAARCQLVEAVDLLKDATEC